MGQVVLKFTYQYPGAKEGVRARVVRTDAGALAVETFECVDAMGADSWRRAAKRVKVAGLRAFVEALAPSGSVQPVCDLRAAFEAATEDECPGRFDDD